MKTFKAALDVALAADNENLVVVDDRIGYVFAGWYSDAELTTAYDYSTVVIAPFTLYAKWVEAPLYQLVSRIDTVKTGSIYSNDKFVIRYAADSLEITEGKVLSFRYRTTATLDYMSVRGPVNWNKQNTSEGFGMKTFKLKEDGWTYVEYEFPKDTDETWFRFDFGTWTARVGDVLEIQDWALNGEPLAIESANVVQKTGDMSVGESLNATYAVIAGGSYEWADVTVSFEMGEHASAIDDDTIKFGSIVEAPETVTPEEGFILVGWFADGEFENEFDFDCPITKDTKIYAKFGEAKKVTFDVNEGSEIAPVWVASGDAVAEPKEPTKAEAVFGGWYADELLSEAYNFATPVTADITLYAKWVPSWTVTLNMNYGETPETKAVYVEKGEVMAAPGNPSRAGYFFGGWYNDAECTAAHDFAATVEANATIYANWEAPTKSYKFTVTAMEEGYGNDRIQFRLKSDSVAALTNLKKGDIVTFMIKSSATLATSETVRIRNIEKPRDVDLYATLGDAVDGWIPVTGILNADKDASGGLYIAIYGADDHNSFAVDDTVEIKALAFNGVEIALTSSSSCGVSPSKDDDDKFYYGVPASYAAL